MTKRNTFKGVEPGDAHPQTLQNQKKLIPWTAVVSPTSQGAQAPPQQGNFCAAEEFTWFEGGALGTWTSKDHWYPPFTVTLLSVRASVDTAPTGATIIVDILKNGTTVFTNTAHRPTIAINAKTSVVTTIDVTGVSVGDELTFQIVQVGSTVTGSDLAVTLGYQACSHPFIGNNPLPGPSSDPYATVIAADHPVRWWRQGDLTGTVMKDSSGNGFNGTYRNSPTLGSTALVVGPDTAVTYASASAQAADVSDAVATRLTTFSIEFWFKTTIAPSTPQALIQSYANTTASGNLRAAAIYIAGSSQLAFECVDNTGLHSGNGITAQDSGSLSINTAYHVVATCSSGGTIKLYKQGVQVASTAIGTPDVAAAVSWYIAHDQGISGGGHVANLDGVLDEIAVYDYTLSQAQITAHYNAGIGA